MADGVADGVVPVGDASLGLVGELPQAVRAVQRSPAPASAEMVFFRLLELLNLSVRLFIVTAKPFLWDLPVRVAAMEGYA